MIYFCYVGTYGNDLFEILLEVTKFNDREDCFRSNPYFADKNRKRLSEKNNGLGYSLEFLITYDEYMEITK